MSEGACLWGIFCALWLLSSPAEVVSEEGFKGAVTALRPVVVGSMDWRIVQRVVNHKHVGAEQCYEQALQRKDTTEGQIVLEWVITSTGSVKDVKVISNDTGDDALSECIVEQVKTWKFPASNQGGQVLVRYPFLFSIA